MSPIAPAAPVSPANAPTLASSAPSANAPSAADPGSFGATLATVDKPPSRKSNGQHGQDAAAGGSTMPPRGNPLPQPPNPPVILGTITPGVLVPMIPLLGALSPAGLAAAQSPAINAVAASAPAPAAPVAGAPATLVSAAGPAAAAARPMAGAQVDPKTLAAGKDASPTSQNETFAAAQSAAADAANSSAALDLSAQNAAAGNAVAAADNVGNDDAAAQAAERIAAMPSGAAAPAKGASPGAANASDGTGSTVAQDSHPVATQIIQAPVAPMLEHHARDGASSASGDLLVNATASAAAGGASVRGPASLDGASLQNAPPAAPNLNSPQLPDQLAAHVSYLVDQNLNGATLQVNPPQLGPIEMRVAIDAGHAQVWLSAHSAATVDALQQTSSKLRDMLASQGFGQVSVDVSQRSFQDRSPQAQPYVWQGGAEPIMKAAGVAGASFAPRAPSGVLDAYA